MNHILITGASSELGIALCESLVTTFHPTLLTLVARRADVLQSMQQKFSLSTHLLLLDLLQEEDLHTLCAYIDAKAPELVINSAGIGLYGHALLHSIKEQENIVQLNTHALVKISLHAARSLVQKARKGVIVNISSAADRLIYPTFNVYAASKSFVSSFSQGFDAEMKPYGVRVLTSAPGPIATSFKQRASKGYALQQATSALSPSQAAAAILWQILHAKPYYVFPWQVRYGRLLLDLLPKRWRFALLKKFLKSSYEEKELREVISSE